MPRCAAIFEQLIDVAQSVRDMNAARPLNLSLRPYFAQKWLMPRLVDFWERHPEIEFSLHHTIQTPSFAKERVDVAIVWGDGQFPGLESRLLLNGDLTPLCHPSVLGENCVPTLELLAHQVLLDEESPHNWNRWLELAGAGDVRPRRHISIDDTNVRLQRREHNHCTRTTGWRAKAWTASMPLLRQCLRRGRTVRAKAL